jgi:hypothetical protein
MIEKERLCVQKGAEGNEIAKEKQKVWYCRDCMCSAPIKK